MKTKIKSIFYSPLFILFLAPAFLSIPSFSQENNITEVNDSWILARDEERVRILEQWFGIGNNHFARRVRAEMEVESSLSAVIATIKDDHDQGKWMNRAEKYYIFNVKNEYHWSNYILFDVPWPFHNQDLVTTSVLSQDPVSGEINIEIRGDNLLIPRQENIDRIGHFEGSWKIIPLNHDRIKIVYTVFTGQKSRLPREVVTPIINYGFWKTFCEMRKIIDYKNKARVELNYIREIP
ncbi:MAG TPA: hypothetical protein VI583_05740 [Cyclobacteriaceae bacterium]|nr:hypothetical protein [Cyclobacteriaceae bacterium]